MTTDERIAARFGVHLDGVSPVALPAGRDVLPGLCVALGFTSGAEVGVWKGAFSERFCQVGLRWIAADPWAPYADYREKKNDAVLIESAYREAYRRLSPFACAMLRMTSREAAAQVPDRSLDIVYIDGNHEAAFVREDLELWSPKVRQGGLLAGHDYREPPAAKPFIQVKAAVDAYVSDHAIAPWFVLAGERTPSFLWVVH